MTHAPLEWPNENIWYLYGGHFVHWVTEQYGPDWMVVLHDEIANDLVPFGINRATHAATGETIPTLYRRWQNHLTQSARTIESQLRKTGLSPLIWQTRVGRSHRGLQTGSDDALYSIEQGESLKSIVSRRGDEKVKTSCGIRTLKTFELPQRSKVLVTRRNIWVVPTESMTSTY